MSAARVYAAENALFGEFSSGSVENWAGATQMFELCVQFLPSGLAVPEIIVDPKEAIGAAKYSPLKNRIVFSPHSLHDWLAIHEISHWADEQMNNGHSGHGRNWADIYIHLTGSVMGAGWGNSLRDALSFVR